ncbi:PSD1 and planctomycete cytochrome C domain-containing protein [Engelhardtia mirabilis]|uniref:Planctomycete cytochrome C n=1 Tax=Engelhardtia mirabilis TaxID=2528011 RepID=A0A518BMG0_9BACT|nr:Planctomycete cytochrome C [Planctomycetes bacterium Pla133]QDV02463.1 Planctomycete cytochrome C [Planctomycetes bacterium Pla86]
MGLPSLPRPERPIAALALLLLAGTGASLALAGAPTGGDADPRVPVRYSRDVRPLLSDRCFLCHGPDEAARAADLRLDTHAFATAERDGGPAIVPGDAEASELWYRITTDDAEDAMPPKRSHRERFSAQERELIRRWIDDGAQYEEHWAFVPPVRPTPPTVADFEHPVDAFVARHLGELGLAPSPEERSDLLLRRLFLDLTGLPPTPAELDAFQADYDAPGSDRDAVWLAWIDRLFGEEPYRSRYAERMTAPWLDQARYADTSGIHMDAGRQIWPWRDWVLAAFRDNMPFDRFLTEQLAGDLLPDATVDQLVASGFNRNHVTTDEGGAIDEEYLVEYAVDRVDTTGQVFLGLTVGCARCHDHKFDPITQEDFYRFFSYFNSNEEPGLYSQVPNPNRALEPFIEVPSAEQVRAREELASDLAALRAELGEPSEQDRAALAQWRSALPGDLGLQWVSTTLVDASSSAGTTFVELDDGSLRAEGPAPATDVHRITLRTDATDLRLLQLDALGDALLENGAPGRADNGNAVLTSIRVEARSVADPSVSEPVELTWAWADYAQTNDDYGVLRAFDQRHNTGWAIAGHTDGSERTALFLADHPFGYEGGTEVTVTLGYESIWNGHSFGRTRLGLATLGEAGVADLPLAQGPWYQAGPFELPTATGAYQRVFGPESDTSLDPMLEFEALEGSPRRWTYRSDFADGVVTSLAGGVNVHYVAKEIWSPEDRSVEVSLGSDDGFTILVNGVQVAASELPRGAAADQNRVTLPLRAGRNALVFKVINTGGAAGFYFSALEGDEVLGQGLVAALVEPGARADAAPDYVPRETAAAPTLGASILHGFRLTRSPDYAARLAREAELVAATEELEASIPRTMVMRERMEPRQTFVLSRGEYDKADPERPVEPGIPSLFAGLATQGEAAGGERATRVDLARWMTSPDNPLVARVAVNRYWQLLFGTGLVATSGDFGFQGSWPTHPQLLDWLATEFVESGWDVQGLLRTVLTSATYRQSSRVRPEVAAIDPDGALLASYPRRRLEAEAIRDLALYTSGLLVEELGGPSVKPYQPPGLWQEIAMLGSNTRLFERGTGEDLWRRSLYTYWKRAAPPPAMLTFDAPTRESCVIKRGVTNTPLQALVLWNDEQYVEAARKLAERSLAEAEGDAAVLTLMFRRCTGRAPERAELAILTAALDDHRARYAAAPEDAAALVAVGEAMLAEGAPDPAELAAWTLVASAILNLHATITQG